MKTIIPTVLITFALVCFALSPQTQAACGSPDPGCPVANLAEGYLALQSLTTGAYNTGIGTYSLLSITNGSFCTGVGAGTLLSNTADENTATGAGALLTNTTGTQNTATGTFSLFNNTTGNGNVGNGFQALASNTTGSGNTASGLGALTSNTDGNENTATGALALTHNIGAFNTANGVNALASNTTGSSNTASGLGALSNNTTGTDNIALGESAGSEITTASDVICIGAGGNNVDNGCYIGQIFNATSSGGSAVFVDLTGRLATATSSRRFKDDIKPMEQRSEALFALKPVSFHYKKEIDTAGISQLGLVAEDVEKVNPDLVVCDKEGKPYSVRYDQVNAMLLNEFLKEHKKVEELEANAACQQKQIGALIAGLQKVTAQLSASKPMPQVVNNPLTRQR
jgi:hypothetical protein